MFERLKMLNLFFVTFLMFQCQNKTQNEYIIETSSTSQPNEISTEDVDSIIDISFHYPPPSIHDIIDEKHRESWVAKNCNSPIINNKLVMDKEFMNSYEESGIITKRQDGAKFCIGQISKGDTSTVQLIYTRTEGGHYSDKVYLINVDLKGNVNLRLCLLSLFYAEGRNEIIESQYINDKLINKVKTQVYYWNQNNAYQEAKIIEKFDYQIRDGYWLELNYSIDSMNMENLPTEFNIM